MVERPWFKGSVSDELVYVDRSTISGRGVFAKGPIRKGDFIGTYEGPVAKRNGKYVLWVTNEKGQETGRRGLNALRYLNHSSLPNAEFEGFDLFAQRQIRPGEEITFDYGDDPSLW